MKLIENLQYERNLWDQGVMHVAGIDEAGRGPLAGPVVAAAVIFPKEIFIKGIRDSKQLSAQQRESLLEEINNKALSVGIGQIEAPEIDKMNILKATLEAMKKAVMSLSVSPQHLLIDGNHLPDCFIPKSAIIGGDRKCYSIAAASIVAKVTRDRLMMLYHDQYPEYGFARHKGYGTKMHIKAIQIYGHCPIHRRSFHVKGLNI
ncbi:ribonuclease HII [bacterium]|nr:ribonuclease HII [bacterium]